MILLLLLVAAAAAAALLCLDAVVVVNVVAALYAVTTDAEAFIFISRFHIWVCGLAFAFALATQDNVNIAYTYA